MIRETLYVLSLSSKEREETKGRYALYHTLVYCVRMLGKEEWEEMGTNVENRDEDPVEEHDSDANVSGSPELDEKQ